MVARRLFSISISMFHLSRALFLTNYPKKSQRVPRRVVVALALALLSLLVLLVITLSDSDSPSSFYSDPKNSCRKYLKCQTQTSNTCISRLSYVQSLHPTSSPKIWFQPLKNALSSSIRFSLMQSLMENHP